MKIQKRFLYFILLMFPLFSLYISGERETEAAENQLWPQFPEGCTVVLVGKNASIDGSVMTTHAADCGMCDWTWRYVPAADYPEEAVRKIYHINQIRTWPPDVGNKWDMYVENDTDVSIPQVPHTYAYIHGVFGYMNDQQLAIGESTIGCRRKMYNNTPSAVMDITTLTLIAMERCKTAREAIKTMGSLAEKYGYGFHDGGEMLAVGDPDEVWIFEIMPVGPLWSPKTGKPGALWCAQRVPDDHVSVCPNESRIGEINLKDQDYFLASSNVLSLAVEQGFYDPESEESFNWKKAYSPNETSAVESGGSRARMWRFFDLVAPSHQFSPDTPNMEFPFSIKPDKKLSLEDVMAIMRDKYQGTPYDPAEGLRGGPFSNPNYHPRAISADGKTYNMPRPISVNRAEYTTVTQSRSWLPNPIGGIVWLAFGAQDTSCFIPFYAGVKRIPPSFSVGDHWVFSRNSARWAFDYVDFHTQVAYSFAIEDVKKAREQYEHKAVEITKAIDTTAYVLYCQDTELAVEFLTDYCNINAEKIINVWWELGDMLLVKYNHLGQYDPEKRKTSMLEYPDWWIQELVKYHDLKPRKK